MWDAHTWNRLRVGRTSAHETRSIEFAHPTGSADAEVRAHAEVAAAAARADLVLGRLPERMRIRTEKAPPLRTTPLTAPSPYASPGKAAEMSVTVPPGWQGEALVLT